MELEQKIIDKAFWIMAVQGTSKQESVKQAVFEQCTNPELQDTLRLYDLDLNEYIKYLLKKV